MAADIRNDFTKGNIWKQLVLFALPIVATSMLQALYSIVDTIVAGHFIGPEGLSAVSSGSQLIFQVTQIAVGMTIGGNSLLGQYFGKKDHPNQQKGSGTLFTFAMITGAVLAVIIFAFAGQWMSLLRAPAYEESVAYTRICAAGILFSYGYNALSAIIRSYGNSRQPLYSIIAATAVNIVLDVWFVAGLGMGVEGTAIATTASQAVTFFVLLFISLRHNDVYGLYGGNLRVEGDKLKRILKVGIPTSVQMMVGGISWLVVLGFINKYNVDVSAAGGVVNKIMETLKMPVSSLAAAAGTMVAQCIGAKEFDRAKSIVHRTVLVNVIFAVILFGVAQFFCEPVISLFTSDPEVMRIGCEHLRIESICFIFYGIFLSYNAMAIGAGHTMFIFFNSFMNCIAMRVVLVVILDGLMGRFGIYWACAFAPLISVPIGMIYMRSGVWKKADLTK